MSLEIKGILPATFIIATGLAVGGLWLSSQDQLEQPQLPIPTSRPPTPAELELMRKSGVDLSGYGLSTQELAGGANGALGKGKCRDSYGKRYNVGDPPTKYTKSVCTGSGWRVILSDGSIVYTRPDLLNP